jgi:hypothetical protein
VSGIIAPGAPLSDRPRTTLILDPEAKYPLTTYRETDARTALTRGLSEYFQNQSITMPGGRLLSLKNVYEVWPEAEQDVEYPAFTCTPEGDGSYDAKSFTPVLRPSDRIGPPDDRWPTSGAEFVQTIRGELHTTDPDARMGLTAMIEDALWPVDWLGGFRLLLPHYFGAVASFSATTMGYPDAAETAVERLRVTYFRIIGRVPVIRLAGLPETRQMRGEVAVAPGAVNLAFTVG